MDMDRAAGLGATDPADQGDAEADVGGGASETAPPKPPFWLQATEADLAGLDIEAPIAGSTSPLCDALSDLYRRAAYPHRAGEPPVETPATRIFAMLSAVTGMYLKPSERDEPYGPMMSGGGRRTAIPADFRGAPVELLAKMAERSVSPVLKARLADLCWLLERRRGALAAAAIVAYVDTIEAVERGELKFPFAHNDGALEFGARDLLRRALVIGWTSGWAKPEALRARDAVARLREQAAALRLPVPLIWFAELDLDFGISDPLSVAAGIEPVLADGVDFHAAISLCRLGARAYHVAKREPDAHRCLAAAAEAMATEAERLLEARGPHAALLAAEELSNAIHQLHGVSGMRDRRTVLRDRLIDVQARIPEEMSVFTHEWDVSAIAREAEEKVAGGALLDKLFVFACFRPPPLLLKPAPDLRVRVVPCRLVLVHLRHVVQQARGKGITAG